MRPKAVFAASGVLASLALAVGLLGPGPAEADKEDGVVRAGDAVIADGVVRAGDAVIDEDGPRIEDGSSADGDEGEGSDGGSGSGDVGNEKGREGAPVGDEVVMRLKGDEGVEFSGTCSVGGEEEEISGRVPEEFTFALDGGELECEINTKGDGMLKVAVLSGDDRMVQRVNGDSTIKFSYSENGVSSSTISGSGSSSVVNQSSSSSSSSVQSSSSSTSSN